MKKETLSSQLVLGNMYVISSTKWDKIISLSKESLDNCLGAEWIRIKSDELIEAEYDLLRNEAKDIAKKIRETPYPLWILDGYYVWLYELDTVPTLPDWWIGVKEYYTQIGKDDYIGNTIISSSVLSDEYNIRYTNEVKKLDIEIEFDYEKISKVNYGSIPVIADIDYLIENETGVNIDKLKEDNEYDIIKKTILSSIYDPNNVFVWTWCGLKLSINDILNSYCKIHDTLYTYKYVINGIEITCKVCKQKNNIHFHFSSKEIENSQIYLIWNYPVSDEFKKSIISIKDNCIYRLKDKYNDK